MTKIPELGCHRNLIIRIVFIVIVIVSKEDEVDSVGIQVPAFGTSLGFV
jgi:hypothetical protein